MPIIYIFRNMALRISTFGRTFSRSITWCNSVTRTRQEVRSNNRNFPLSLNLKSMNGNQLIVPGGFFQNTSTVCSAVIPVALVTSWRKLWQKEEMPWRGKTSQNVSADKRFPLRGEVGGLVLFEHALVTSVPSAAHLGGTCRWPVPADQLDLQSLRVGHHQTGLAAADVVLADLWGLVTKSSVELVLEN